MALKLIVLVCVAVVVLGDQSPVYPAPPVYGYPAPPPEYPEVPPKYTYNYGVADDYSGANFGHSENRDGYKTEGSYTVDLPDGRKQTVTYVDNGDGLEAVVTYEGEAQYPEYQPSYPAPHPPIYHPAPSYPAPTPPAPTYEEE
ncbi:cuticle protein 7-like [Homarus americanus]|uniref:Pro-resilin-like 139 n=1 Tax=Homarus americanus TaxID=6706 RepID=A0A8J5K6C3_HOMAM|nr:cuticle protein 7-like [Homarus americanus]KAG7171377.1 Pro-resilin-like 139 [Homarus americanus]